MSCFSCFGLGYVSSCKKGIIIFICFCWKVAFSKIFCFCVCVARTYPYIQCRCLFTLFSSPTKYPNRIFNKETYFLNVFWFPISFQKMIIQFRNGNMWNDFLFLSTIVTSWKWQSKWTSIYFLFCKGKKNTWKCQ